MDGEDKDITYNYGSKPPAFVPEHYRFEPTYGWSAEAPMIHTIASLHHATITELKFCGFAGAFNLFQPTPITGPLLAGLKYFDKLETLILSTWLSTIFEGNPCDNGVISYWLDSRSESSTSLVITNTDEEPQGWAKELRTKFAPDALARQVTSFIGPMLSEQAKLRTGGVHVRVGMCLGESNAIFDLDLRIGKIGDGDICFNYKGPREELEPERRREKIENRRWF